VGARCELGGKRLTGALLWLDPGGDWPDEIRARLLGVQACLWSENLHDRRLFDHLTFPRLSAVAESAWTTPARKDFERFRATHMLTREPAIE
jgi:hexosaminidase